MMRKLFNTLFLGVCGAFLGGMAGYVFFSGINMIRTFTIYPLLLLLVIIIVKLSFAIRNISLLGFLGTIFRSVVVWAVIVSISGLIWLFVSEGGELDDLDSLLLVCSMIISIVLFAFLIPLRILWHDSSLGQRAEKILIELAPLLGRRRD